MKKLTEIETRTDKVDHAYLEVYESLLDGRTVNNMIELGLWEGDSLQLWHDYFPITTSIAGIDIDLNRVRTEIERKIVTDGRRLTLYGANAYIPDQIKTFFNFDFIVDDGPHDLASMVTVAQHWSRHLTRTGVLVIEDVPTIEWIRPLTLALPDELRRASYGVDRRAVATTETSDSIMFVVDGKLV